MPLPSSGNQIALSQIRNEYGLGSGQIAMSQLYGKGNAPASSGAIQCGGHFHGTSAVTYFLNSNVGSGTFQTKASPTATNRYGYSDGITNPAMGSMVSTAISNTGAYVRQITNMTGFSPQTQLQFSSAYTAWTKIIINGNVTLTRSSANVNNGNKDYRWNRSQGGITNLKIL